MADTTGSGLKGELQDVPRVVDKSLPLLRSRWSTVVHLQKLAKADDRRQVGQDGQRATEHAGHYC